ncbi:glycine cleavage system protein GcvH [Mucilaginibacter sp. HC2]|uniref:glycine cleavage system protein GcvH n=1 Tax=Mucilaginibacter inviolabilis TaxID=2714892 RepID=UPI00140BD3EC|nr:glycine cleavage system protein GcvH [Mucilaginibacter inviolabilis]NHA03414.1 glycine cleavage system protein GcvH [Mucilaginibacter inviolabilis]
MKYPEHLFYTRDHEWISFENEHALIGITDFAQKELGDIVYVDIPSLDKIIVKEAIFGTVEAVKTVSDLFMPVNGKVIAINPLLETNPELVNQDPYGSWMIKVLVTSASDRESLLNAEQYQALIVSNPSSHE